MTQPHSTVTITVGGVWLFPLTWLVMLGLGALGKPISYWFTLLIVWVVAMLLFLGFAAWVIWHEFRR